MRTLLVLGNGFDINCNLKSKFSDFFATKIEETSCNGQKGLGLRKEYRNNIWYIIFFYAFYGNRVPTPLFDVQTLFPLINKTSPLWMDVESYIKKIMTLKNKKIGEYLSYPGERTYIDIIKEAYDLRNNHSHVLSRRTQFRDLQDHFVMKEQYVKNKTMTEYLFQELRLFEDYFKKYLSNEVKEKETDYKTNSRLLLKKLRDYSGQSLYILSFNYTSSGATSNDELNHVHGSLGNRVIIGYDSSELNSSNNPSLMLTKGWQKLFSDSPESKLPQKEYISCIKFYGHSLGEQDYSYFHALFDYYDVYSRDVSLIFYYTEYKETPQENEILRANYISKVYALLDKYVEESEKENKRKTFVSRLQLENRLQIKRIPVLNIEKKPQ